MGSMLNDSPSPFDHMIKTNFETHLELTLLANPDLICKYPHYRDVMQHFMQRLGLSFNNLQVPALLPVDLTLRYTSTCAPSQNLLSSALRTLLPSTLQPKHEEDSDGIASDH